MLYGNCCKAFSIACIFSAAKHNAFSTMNYFLQWKFLSAVRCEWWLPNASCWEVLRGALIDCFPFVHCRISRHSCSAMFFLDNFDYLIILFFCSIGPTLSSMFLLKQYRSIGPALLLPTHHFDPGDLYDWLIFSVSKTGFMRLHQKQSRFQHSFHWPVSAMAMHFNTVYCFKYYHQGSQRHREWLFLGHFHPGTAGELRPCGFLRRTRTRRVRFESQGQWSTEDVAGVGIQRVILSDFACSPAVSQCAKALPDVW